jgi:hypothetical protein
VSIVALQSGPALGPQLAVFALLLVFGVVLGGFWACRRAVRAAEDDAAAQVGADTVADAIERYAAVHAMEPPRRRVPNPLSANVAFCDRIDRLRDR